MSQVTISTHNGTTVCLAHNIREKKIIEAENKKWARTHPEGMRIDISRSHLNEIFRYIPLGKAYQQIFGDAIKEYNEKQLRQGKKDRVIKNYLSELKAKEKLSKNAKKPVYEMIYQIGGKDNPISDEMAKKILSEIALSFEERNPNLFVVCSALHMDEESVHLHISYVPVAYDCTKGPRVQNSLTNALKQQGISNISHSQTAQMFWEKRENEYLEELVQKAGYEVIHPQAGKMVEHLSVEEFKVKKDIEAARQELNRVIGLPTHNVLIKKGRLEELEKKERELDLLSSQREKINRDSRIAQNEFEAYEKRCKALAEREDKISQLINEEANRKAEMINNEALNYIRKKGIYEEYINSLKLIQKRLYFEK